VKYGTSGDMAWRKNFGGYYDSFQSVISVPDGIVVTGYSYLTGDGDWVGVMSKGDIDAVIMKYGTDV
jgi:hypothetical protein